MLYKRYREGMHSACDELKKENHLVRQLLAVLQTHFALYRSLFWLSTSGYTHADAVGLVVMKCYVSEDHADCVPGQRQRYSHQVSTPL